MGFVPTYLYYRESLFKDELPHAKKHFECHPTYLSVTPGETIVARYSMWPFYRDQERDIKALGGQLLNTHQQHLYVADLGEWYHDLCGVTPETWDRFEDVPDEGAFVLKGQTNSKKSFWSSMMFAKDKREAIQVHSRLMQDGLIGDQKIYIRRYVPLHTYHIGIQGLPVTKEFRFFVYKGTIVAGGFYWSGHTEDIGHVPDPREVPDSFLRGVIERVGSHVNFYTIDVAQTQAGDWIVIELNDGCQAGLSMIDPDQFYGALAQCLPKTPPRPTPSTDRL